MLLYTTKTKQKKPVSNVAFHCYLQKVVTARVRTEYEGVAPDNFARGSEPLLHIEGTIVYSKKGTRIPSLNTKYLATTRWSKRGVGGKYL